MPIYKNLSTRKKSSEASTLPSTSKGDIVVHNGSTNVRLPVGGQNQILSIDFLESTALKWIDQVTPGQKVLTSSTGDISNSTVTPLQVSALNLAISPNIVYQFQYFICYRSATAATGIRFSLSGSGIMVWNCRWVDTSGATSTSPDQNQLTPSIMSSFSNRGAGASGTTTSVDTANADMFCIIEGIINSSIGSTLILSFNSETGGVNTTVKAGTSLVMTKIN